MKDLSARSYERLMRLMAGAKEMSLATIRSDGFPQATTVNFVNDELIVYAVIGPTSQKAHDIQLNNRVSVAFHLAFKNSQSVIGISMGGRASIVDDPKHKRRITRIIQDKFPDYVEPLALDSGAPWQGMKIIAIEPEFISILDYGEGFGHTELFAIDPIELNAWGTKC